MGSRCIGILLYIEIFLYIYIYSESLQYRDMFTYGYEFWNCKIWYVEILQLRLTRPWGTWRVPRWRHFI